MMSAFHLRPRREHAPIERDAHRYPKQHRLLVLKKESVATHALPPFYLPYSDLSQLQQTKFDSILVDPPFTSNFTWDDLQELPIPSLAADPSFVFLWVGSGAGGDLERGREVLAKWGYRRCEDVVWVQTNKTSNKGPGTDRPTSSLLTRTKQHCLIGIRGTVRRSTDHWFVHCNNGASIFPPFLCFISNADLPSPIPSRHRRHHLGRRPHRPLPQTTRDVHPH